MPWKELTLAGWGRAGAGAALAARPERTRDVALAFTDATAAGEGKGLIAHGGGRSYGDQALNGGGRVLLTSRLNRLLAFDPVSGELVVEPGVTFRDLLDVFLPRGFLCPVTPGTAFATIGGAVANDVHGKNHEVAGSFGDHVSWLDLMLPNGEIRRISPGEHEDLFRATVGGCGLTGVILAICFALRPVPSGAVDVREMRVRDLDGFLEALDRSRDQGQYSVGWIDALAGGGSLGRGILEIANPSEEEAVQKPPRRMTVPFDFPGFALNSLSVRAFNDAYWRRVPASGRQRKLSYERFLYPLDAIGQWNRIYGRRGFRQFQCVLPAEQGREGLRELLEEIGRARSASFLAVLKAMGAEGRGYLSFPRPGYTLALDFPRRPGEEAFFARLEKITRDHGGRIYLAKDSLLSAEGFREMYPAHEPFREVLERIDPEGRMSSDMARRLKLREVTP